MLISEECRQDIRISNRSLCDISIEKITHFFAKWPIKAIVKQDLLEVLKFCPKYNKFKKKTLRKVLELTNNHTMKMITVIWSIENGPLHNIFSTK